MPEKKYKKELTARQYQFIDWLDNNFQYGDLFVKIHNSEPVDVEIDKMRHPFDGKTGLPVVRP
jgi:hypothetical protein